jgi:phosphonate transport system substrate-binding protein
MADNIRPLFIGVADYVSRRTGIRARLIVDVPWQEQERLLDQGAAQVGFICGLLYTQKTEHVELLAAPVLSASRYQDRPIYFSDIVVRHDSPFHSFADLRGATWAYNDPGSFSGYAALRAHLAALGETAGYAGRLVESGSHLRSLGMVAEGLADTAAIDSAVMELELKRCPELASQLRTVAALGPSTIPPVVIARAAPAEIKQQLRDALLRMHADEHGRAILSSGTIARFIAVRDADYNDIRRKALSAEAVVLCNRLE